jgi:hypothetical protein
MEIIADNLSKARLSGGCSSAIDSNGGNDLDRLTRIATESVSLCAPMQANGVC